MCLSTFHVHTVVIAQSIQSNCIGPITQTLLVNEQSPRRISGSNDWFLGIKETSIAKVYKLNILTLLVIAAVV
ncbi:hypothetical protein, partial [Paenibacillus tengchongensis]|uniref:hypothetical protein n=1 Tax=Paenibacillus tengchongensis TaxID=2608684 RepID=UPI001C9E9198